MEERRKRERRNVREKTIKRGKEIRIETRRKGSKKGRTEEVNKEGRMEEEEGHLSIIPQSLCSLQHFS